MVRDIPSEGMGPRMTAIEVGHPQAGHLQGVPLQKTRYHDPTVYTHLEQSGSIIKRYLLPLMFKTVKFPDSFGNWSGSPPLEGFHSSSRTGLICDRDDEIGKQVADTLVKVWLRNGAETCLLTHVEVQGQAQVIFPERMYIYNSRIFDLYRRPVVSLAVLADEDADESHLSNHSTRSFDRDPLYLHGFFIQVVCYLNSS